MKKVLSFLLISVLMLAACSSGSDTESTSGESKDTNQITVWAWDPNFNIKAFNIAKETYQAENPDLEIKIVENGQKDIVQKLNTTLSSGTTKGLPNIVLIEDYRAQGFLQAYPDMFHKLSDTIDADAFASYKMAPTSVDGENYGLPFDTGVTGLYFRTDYLEEAGYSVEDMQNITWDEYIEIGKKVKEATGKNMLTQDPKEPSLLRVMIQTVGSWYVKEDGKTPNIEGNEALKEAFETYKAMLEADIVKPVSDWSQFVGAFNSGEVATVPTGNWITPSVKAEESQAGKWAVAPIPRQSSKESVNASNLGGSSIYVLNIDGKEQAVDFLAKTFGSNVDFYEKLNKEMGAIGTYIPAAESEAYKAEDEFFGGQQVTADFAAWMEQIPQVNYGLHTYAIEDILAVEMQNYLKGKDLDQVLKDAQQQAEAQIK
ncbi:ABC transporter substrate-binding protein [Mesobacillus campisalis]|uniref:ABC transporter substrate-binding protein n=1 Tax=Mesobacillus campisalis TaxID=1408103 RepID=A0A0M2SWY0_9BACI|nr:ABC transporter substrate-binding protein [Mesobacillus campisalis]KKK38673.1 ABC transporter substrate-binding protein [Mesobacillus campisalis]